MAGPGPVALLATSGDEPSLEERVRRFDEVARLVFGAARRRPLLVVLDDLDGADEPSQLLAQYLARTARDDRLLVVVCCRDTAGPIATLAQEPNTAQVELRGLERAAVGEQVSAIVGRAASDAELAAVYDATCGQPVLRVRACPSAGRGARRSRGPYLGRCSTRSASASDGSPQSARRRCVLRRCSVPGSRCPSSQR